MIHWCLMCSVGNCSIPSLALLLHFGTRCYTIQCHVAARGGTNLADEPHNISPYPPKQSGLNEGVVYDCPLLTHPFCELGIRQVCVWRKHVFFVFWHDMVSTRVYDSVHINIHVRNTAAWVYISVVMCRCKPFGCVLGISLSNHTKIRRYTHTVLWGLSLQCSKWLFLLIIPQQLRVYLHDIVLVKKHCIRLCCVFIYLSI